MKIDIVKRYSFKYYDSLIAHMIENGYDLERGDLWHIYNNMDASKSRAYNRLGCAIIYLIDELKGEKAERLVELLNKSFQYKRIATNKYSFICNNRLIGQYLVNLEEQLRSGMVDAGDMTEESAMAFKNFKALF